MRKLFPYFSPDRLKCFINPVHMNEMIKIFDSIEIGEPINETSKVLYEQFITEEVIIFDRDIEYKDYDTNEGMQKINHYDVFHNNTIVAKYGNPFDLMREYKIYKTLENENCIPKIIDIYKSEKRKDKYILVMEYIEGITLLDYIHSITFNIVEFEQIINNVLLTLDRLYKKYNFCHYDLHADNIIITNNNDIYFLDFEYSYINNCIPTNHGALYGIHNDKPNPSFDILKLCMSLYEFTEFKEIVNIFVEDIKLIDNTLIYYQHNKLTYKDFYHILNGVNKFMTAYSYCNIL